MNILARLEKSDKIALVQGKRKIDFAELLERGLRFGGHLVEQELKKDDEVLMFVPLSIDLYVAMIGAWSIGAVPIFVDFSRGVDFVNETVKRLRPKVVICDHVTSLVRRKYPELKKIQRIKVEKQASAVKPVSLAENHPAILTFTSGTTGTPKTVVRSHGFLIKQYEVLAKHVDFSATHIDLGTLAVFTLANLASKMTTVLPKKRYKSKVIPSELAKSIEQEKVSRLIGSPKLMSDLLAHSQLRTVKVAYLGGAPVYPSVIDKIPAHIEVHIVYGSTEAEPIAHLQWSQMGVQVLEKIKSGYGLPVGNVVPEIDCMIGANHEILVKGLTVLAKDGANAWHKTGDTGFFDENNLLWLTGKVNQTINDQHGTLHPFAVECVLDSYFAIRGAVLSIDGRRIVVVEKENPSKRTILDVLKDFQIEDVVVVECLPMDKRHGAKIDYQRVREMIK